MPQKTQPKNWTPETLRNKQAESWQKKFYATGTVAGAISWISFANEASGAGSLFAIAAMAAFLIGGIIRTTWEKSRQLDVYVKDKARESARLKCFGTGVFCGVVSLIGFLTEGHSVGTFFAIASVSGFLLGGILPIKWIKKAEAAKYR